MERIGLMGGSFNPVHLGHVNLARTALDSGLVDRVLFLPTGNPPHKREGLADKYDRLEMVRLAVQNEKCMGVCREEVDRQGVIYTVDTMGVLGQKMLGCTFFYIIGADSLLALHTWRDPQTLIGRCAFLVVMRPGEDERRTMEAAEYWRARGARIVFLPARPMDVSSTQIRERARKGLPFGELVPDGVEAYIRRHGLYQASGERPDETR